MGKNVWESAETISTPLFDILLMNPYEAIRNIKEKDKLLKEKDQVNEKHSQTIAEFGNRIEGLNKTIASLQHDLSNAVTRAIEAESDKAILEKSQILFAERSNKILELQDEVNKLKKENQVLSDTIGMAPSESDFKRAEEIVNLSAKHLCNIPTTELRTVNKYLPDIVSKAYRYKQQKDGRVG